MNRIKLPKARIAQNRYDNWYGYLGTRRVIAFGRDAQGSAEQHAQEWLADPEARAYSLLLADFARSERVED
jgi:hypothetical protein